MKNIVFKTLIMNFDGKIKNINNFLLMHLVDKKNIPSCPCWQFLESKCTKTVFKRIGKNGRITFPQIL
jgi:hypothetical protein